MIGSSKRQRFPQRVDGWCESMENCFEVAR